jgi:hypothetical protein
MGGVVGSSLHLDCPCLLARMRRDVGGSEVSVLSRLNSGFADGLCEEACLVMLSESVEAYLNLVICSLLHLHSALSECQTQVAVIEISWPHCPAWL